MDAFNVPDVTMVEIAHWLEYMRRSYNCETHILIVDSPNAEGHALLCINGITRCGNSQHRPIHIRTVREVGDISMRQVCRELYNLFFEFNETVDGGCPECWADSQKQR